MSAASLSFADVRFSYPGCPVFDGLTLDVAAGEFSAVLGPNGSGKTTLLRLATRVVRPAAGRVLVGGRDLRKLGFVFILEVRPLIQDAAGLVLQLFVGGNASGNVVVNE